MFTTSVGVFVFGLLATIAGGAVGAAIGGNYAFVLTGFCVLASWGVFAATGNTFGLDYLAFGPFMGPTSPLLVALRPPSMLGTEGIWVTAKTSTPRLPASVTPTSSASVPPSAFSATCARSASQTFRGSASTPTQSP